MKNEQFKKYLYIGLTVFISLAASILLFFMLDRIQELGGVLKVFLDAAKPIIYGAIMAYLLYPVCRFCEKQIGKIFKKMKNRKIANKLTRFISIFISFVFGFGIVAVMLYLVIPQLYVTIAGNEATGEPGIIGSIPLYIEKIIIFVDNQFAENEELRVAVTNAINGYNENITQLLTDWSGQIGIIVKSVSDGVLMVFNTAIDIFVGIIVAIYLLADRNKFKKNLKRFIDVLFKKNTARAIKEEIKYSNAVAQNFITGRILDSTIIGLLCYILMLVLRLPFPLLISVIIGVTNVIPFFGPFIGAIPSALLILIEDPIKCLIFVIMIFILQQVDGNIIGPRVVGDSIGLSSFWVLFAILIFGEIFGITGMLIGVPVFAIIYDIIKKVIEKAEAKKKQKEPQLK